MHTIIQWLAVPVFAIGGTCLIRAYIRHHVRRLDIEARLAEIRDSENSATWRIIKRG